MELCLARSTKLTLKNVKSLPKEIPAKMANIGVVNLEEFRPGLLASLHLLNKLSRLVLVSIPETSGNQIRISTEFGLHVAILYGRAIPDDSSQSVNAILKLKDAETEDGLLKRLVSVCGGSKNISANLELEFKSVENKLIFNDMEMNVCMAGYEKYFNLPSNLAQKWKAKSELNGTLSLTLNLNIDAVNRIYKGGQKLDKLDTEKLLEGVGDAILVLENGVKLPCHRFVLTTKSDEFRAMFATEMQETQKISVSVPNISESGARALLAYLYCNDIKEALCCSQIAVELLMAADKYKIQELSKIIKDVICKHDNNSFTLASAVKLLTLVAGKGELDVGLKRIENKAKTIIQAQPEEELKECEEFRKLFNNPDSGMSTCMYLMQLKKFEDLP